jgi:hypothetical protein
MASPVISVVNKSKVAGRSFLNSKIAKAAGSSSPRGLRWVRDSEQIT